MPIPVPEPGLVISYAYLWHYEHLAGAEEGRKSRPTVVVLISPLDTKSVEVTVLPITRRAPEIPEWAIEIPAAIKRHLGLDDGRSWVIVAECNDFLWPGYDLRKVADTNKYDYGYLPPRFFKQVLAAFDGLRAAGVSQLSTRD